MNPLQEESRTQRKRRDIVDAAVALFLEHGYEGTSMDQVAARATVSKQTVYKQFKDKESLFAEVVLGLADTAQSFIDLVHTLLAEPDDVERALKQLARDYLSTVMQPQVLRLRRLLIGEAARFPQLGGSYYERVAQRTMDSIAGAFEHLASLGKLQLTDPALAAQHFAFLVLAAPLDRALICGDGQFTNSELDRLADEAVRVFLAAYG